jgi:hypothetical protein
LPGYLKSESIIAKVQRQACVGYKKYRAGVARVVNDILIRLKVKTNCGEDDELMLFFVVV